MADVEIDSDRFGSTIESILSDIELSVDDEMPSIVSTGLRKGAAAWRRNANKAFEPGRTYRRHGQTHSVGAYAKSIRSHMTGKSRKTPSGEIGSPTMPGLPHLLEEGHARVGGGRVPGVEHIAPAAQETFDETYLAAVEAVERILHDV